MALSIGSRVIVPWMFPTTPPKYRKGVVRWLGKIEDVDRVGIELDTRHGANDGLMCGVRYFQCERFFGILAFECNVKIDPDFLAKTTAQEMGNLFVYWFSIPLLNSICKGATKKPVAFTEEVQLRIAANRAKALLLMQSTMYQQIVPVLKEATCSQEMVHVQRLQEQKPEVEKPAHGNIPANKPQPRVVLAAKLKQKTKAVQGFTQAELTSPPPRKRKVAVDERATTIEPKSTVARRRLGTPPCPCKAVQHDFPFAFRFGSRSLELCVRRCENSETTLVFSLLNRGSMVPGSAVVSTKEIAPRFASFTFDVVGQQEAAVAEVAMRTIFLFLQLQSPEVPYFENTVWNNSERTCTKLQFSTFLKNVDLFQGMHGSTEMASGVEETRRKISLLLQQYICGGIVDIRS